MLMTLRFAAIGALALCSLSFALFLLYLSVTDWNYRV